MSRTPSLGLGLQVVIYLALVLGAFIVITELSVSELTRVAMNQQAELAASGASLEEIENKTEARLSNLQGLVLFYMIFGAAVALLTGSFIIARLIVRPIGRVTTAVEQVSEGMLDTEVPIQGAGEIARLGVSFNRMTVTLREQRDELEQQLEELGTSSANLKAMQDRLIRAAKLASVGTLAAGIAHEIGNPIAGVLGLLDALEYETDESAKARYRDLMKKEVERIDRIIGELLVYARPKSTSDDASSGPESTDVEEVLSHVQSLLGMQKLFDKVRIERDLAGGPFRLAVPRDELLQVFMNLLLNAAEAMEGEGEILISGSEVDAWRPALGAVERPAVRFTVTDNGPGIPEDDAPNIFDPFFTNRKSGEGTGLGLAICMAICERSGGEIGLNPQFDGGTQFTLTFIRA